MTRFREPTLIDLLHDPVIRLVMKADDVTKADILELYTRDEAIQAHSPPVFICNRLIESAKRPEA